MNRKLESEEGKRIVKAGSKTPQKELPVDADVFLVNGNIGFVSKVDGRDKDEAWVWYAPTLEGLPGPEEQWMFQKFHQAGISVAGIDVGESFGSPEGRSFYSEFYTTVTEQRGLSARPCLLARSRGGLMLYNWAAEHPEYVAGIAGIYPVGNVLSYPGLAKASDAYGLSESELKRDIQLHNPVDRLAPLAENRVPIFHIHGDCDTVVPLEANSALLAERYCKLGGEMVLRVVEDQGHNMWTGWFQCEELVQFVIDRATE